MSRACLRCLSVIGYDWGTLSYIQSTCRHQSPEWTILSHNDCFIHGEVFEFQVLLDSLHPHSTRTSWWSPVLQGKKLLRSWHLFHVAFAQCGWTGRNSVLGQFSWKVWLPGGPSHLIIPHLSCWYCLIPNSFRKHVVINICLGILKIHIVRMR